MATVAASPRPSSAQASHEPLVLPLLPEMQAARPPTAPSRRPPDDNSSRQVPDDYFTLPRIETATRMAEDPNPYQPPQAAVSTRVPGSKLAKTGEGLDVSKGGDGGVRSPQREAVSLKDRGDAAGPDLGVSRSSALDATLDGRESAEPNAGAQRSGDTGSAAPETGTRVGSVAQEKKAARRGPLPSQVRKHQEKDGFAARLAGATGPHPGERKGEFSSVGKADATVGRDDHGEVIVTDEGHGVGVPQTETPEQRLDRIRQSNVRNNYNTKAGDGKDALLGLTKKDANEVSNLNPSSPRRARQADHEFGYKTTFYEEMPEIMDDKASRRGQMLAAPYGKNMGLHQPLEPLEPFEIKMQIRITQLRYVEKAAPDLEAKPPPALSVESGDAAKNKDMSNTPEMVSGSDETARGQNGAGRKEWYGDVGKRTPVVRFAQHGSDGGSDATEFRLQPATAHGVDVGFERTMAYSQKRSQGVQLDQKDLGLDNYQTPSGGYVPSQPDRTKHMGSDGTRAQARAEVAVAAPIKLPRQEGFMVDRDKDSGMDEERMAAIRLVAPREQSITRTDEITEESRLAHKQAVVLEGPGKLEDTDYEELDLRPSELAIKIKEKRGAYAVPKDLGLNEGRDARPIPQELQLKPPLFQRQKGSGEDKMRSAYY